MVDNTQKNQQTAPDLSTPEKFKAYLESMRITDAETGKIRAEKRAELQKELNQAKSSADSAELEAHVDALLAQLNESWQDEQTKQKAAAIIDPTKPVENPVEKSEETGAADTLPPESVRQDTPSSVYVSTAEVRDADRFQPDESQGALEDFSGGGVTGNLEALHDSSITHIAAHDSPAEQRSS